MKIRISPHPHGSLFLERNGRFKSQGCIYDQKRYCGDDCPLFGEPTKITYNVNEVFTMVEFKICKRAWKVNENDFIDERK